ncbi:MAG TPA: D-2-hydroxyacid dehydrogenase [Bryobacteraceae bacterium]|nr:D-2-hydroxyacid dehydrogenase [Bryobacteraceae bacterium]
MDDNTVLVLANPADPHLALLEHLPPDTSIAVGERTEAFERTAPEASVILNWSGTRELLEQVFRMAPRLRWVHSRSAGLEDLLFPALVESGITLTNARGVFSQSLGEFVIAAALFFAKDLRRMVRSQMAGVWDQFDIAMLSGGTMGIVGYGEIGRAAAARAKAMGMRVLALRRHPHRSAGDPLVDAVFPAEQRRELLAQSDYIVITAPLTTETRGLIGAGELAVMKPTAVLINVGRGPVVDEAALLEALASGRIRGAALDVFDQEPLPAGHPLYGLENVLLSPHCADHTPDWQEQTMRFFLENYRHFHNGEPLRNVVNKRLGY